MSAQRTALFGQAWKLDLCALISVKHIVQSTQQWQFLECLKGIVWQR